MLLLLLLLLLLAEVRGVIAATPPPHGKGQALAGPKCGKEGRGWASKESTHSARKGCITTTTQDAPHQPRQG